MGKRDLFHFGAGGGRLLGLDGFMWKESVVVNRIAVTSVGWFLWRCWYITCARWIYAPHQTRLIASWAGWLYWCLLHVASELNRRRYWHRGSAGGGQSEAGPGRLSGKFHSFGENLVMVGVTATTSTTGGQARTLPFPRYRRWFRGHQHLAGGATAWRWSNRRAGSSRSGRFAGSGHTRSALPQTLAPFLRISFSALRSNGKRTTMS